MQHWIYNSIEAITGLFLFIQTIQFLQQIKMKNDPYSFISILRFELFGLFSIISLLQCDQMME